MLSEEEKILSHREAVKKHNANNVYQFKCAFNVNTDKALIDHLTAQPNKQGYVKSLILKDMERGQK